MNTLRSSLHPRLRLYAFSTFLCGLVVMATELSASRLLAPYFGNSLYVWTNLITLVMMGLAFGYALGGWLSDKRPDEKLYFLMIWTAGLWILMIPFFASPLFSLLLELAPNLAWTAKVGSFLAILLLFVLPLFVLGAIVPFTLKLSLKHLEGVGALSGKLSMISSAGSLIGSFLPAFLLLPLLGTTATFLLLGLCLFFLGAYGLRNVWLFILGLGGLLLFFIVPPVYADDRMIAYEDSAYGFIFVTEDGEGVRRLHIDTPLGTQSIYDPETALSADRYYYPYFGILPAMVPEAKSVLILGHAGGSFTRIFNTYYPELEVTGVELDPKVTEMAQVYMGLDQAEVSIVHSDARAFLLSTDESYDLILVDTYHGANIPAHLATEEFFTLCTEHLNAEGILALNAASTEGIFLDTLANSLAQPFGSVYLAPIPSSFNFMLITQENGSYELMSPLTSDLQAKWETFLEQDPELRKFDPQLGTFKDDTLSEVEVLDEQMFMQLLEAL